MRSSIIPPTTPILLSSLATLLEGASVLTAALAAGAVAVWEGGAAWDTAAGAEATGVTGAAAAGLSGETSWPNLFLWLRDRCRPRLLDLPDIANSYLALGCDFS